MPHKCTNCGEVLEDGTDEVLDGCPVCGSGKFRYVGDLSNTDDDNDDIIEASQFGSSVSETANSGSDSSSYYSGDWPDHHGADETQPESSAETETVEEPETDTPDGERIRQEKLRQELMEQFESIRIIEPGSYKINLMNLYDNDERVITLQEDGRYQISLPSVDDD